MSDEKEKNENQKQGAKVFADLTSDPGFKMVFADEANKDVLINLLNAILPPEKRIEDLKYLDREQTPLFHNGYTTKLDLHCTSQYGEEFIVEMQNSGFPRFFQRCVAYSGRTYAANMRRGWGLRATDSGHSHRLTQRKDGVRGL